jgi:hypothetical protein
MSAEPWLLGEACEAPPISLTLPAPSLGIKTQVGRVDGKGSQDTESNPSEVNNDKLEPHVTPRWALDVVKEEVKKRESTGESEFGLVWWGRAQAVVARVLR